MGFSVHRAAKAKVFHQAAVVLNNLHPAEFAGVNCRVFEAAGSGGAILTEAREGLSELFDVGTDLLTYTSFGELKERATYLLEDRSAGQELARSAGSRAHRDHTYERRLTQILSSL
jgi:spore maturation protein CgeB